MAITFIGCNIAIGETVEIPPHGPGDLIFFFAVKNYGNTTGGVPFMDTPPGVCQIATYSNENPTYRAKTGYKIAKTSSESSGRWSNSGMVAAIVYRSDRSLFYLRTSNVLDQNVISNTITYREIQSYSGGNTDYDIQLFSKANQWVWGFLYSNSNEPDLMQSLPSHFVLRGSWRSDQDGTGMLFDTGQPVSSLALHTDTLALAVRRVDRMHALQEGLVMPPSSLVTVSPFIQDVIA